MSVEDTPFEQGKAATSILDNPYWIEWPKPSSKGKDDEMAACRFVDGWVEAFQCRNITLYDHYMIMTEVLDSGNVQHKQKDDRAVSET